MIHCKDQPPTIFLNALLSRMPGEVELGTDDAGLVRLLPGKLEVDSFLNQFEVLKNVLKHFFFGFKTLLSELNFDAFTCNLPFGILCVWIGWGSIELAVGGPATCPQFQR